jgi:ketosteroid isomerase-like protein
MAQNSTMLVGHNEIRQWFEAWLPDPTITNDFQTEVVEVAASGEIAYERGTYKVTVETEAGRMEAVGKYLCIWKKIDGVWKVAVDISNRDTPPAGN